VGVGLGVDDGSRMGLGSRLVVGLRAIGMQHHHLLVGSQPVWVELRAGDVGVGVGGCKRSQEEVGPKLEVDYGVAAASMLVGVDMGMEAWL